MTWVRGQPPRQLRRVRRLHAPGTRRLASLHSPPTPHPDTRAGSGPYSTARWNPFGRFFALAGFGNLPGDLVFYDKKLDGKCKQMGATR